MGLSWYFLISQDSKSQVVQQLVRQLVYATFISNNRALLHLGWKENLVKHQKVSKYYENDSGYQISLWTVLNFETKFAKRVFSVKNEKNEHYHWILHIRISLSSKFQLKLKSLIFWTKFSQKGRFQSKRAKLNIIIEFCILGSLGTKFQLRLTI